MARTTTPLYLAPNFAIKRASSPLSDAEKTQVVEIRVESHVELAGMFRIQFSAGDGKAIDTLIDKPTWAIGDEVEIELGYFNELRNVITGQVAVLQPSFPENGAPSLTLIGYDRSQALRHGCKFRQFQGLNDSGIVQELAQANGLTVSVAGGNQPAQVSGLNGAASAGDQRPESKSVSHLGSDWELLETLAERNGFEVFVRSKTLHFQAPSTTTKPVTLTWRSDLRSFSPRVTASEVPSQVRFRVYDDSQAQPVVSIKSLGDLMGAFAWGPGRFQKEVAAQLSGRAEGWVRDHRAATVTKADSLAMSLLGGAGRGLVSGSGTCRGNSGLEAGGAVQIEGVGQRFGGIYRLRQVTHLYSKGYETQFVFGPRHSASLLEQLRRPRNSAAGTGPKTGE